MAIEQAMRAPTGRSAATTSRSAARRRPTYRAAMDEAELIRQYVPLVKRSAMRLQGRLPDTVQLDDLVQAGLIAVLRIARHDGIIPPSDPLLQRAITNAMIDEARREAWAPVRTVRLAKTAAQAMRAIKARLGRDGGDEEIAAEMGLDLRDYHRALIEIAGIRLLHIDAFDPADDDGLRVTGNQEAALDRTRLLETLARLIAALPEREKLVISLYYEQELNMEEVGKVLGLDKSTVCRAHGRALLMLRAAFGETAEESPTAAEG